MASIQGPNPLDRLAAYFKPCTREFSQDEYHNIEDTLSELRERQQKNPLDNLDVFFQPLTMKSDYSNDDIWTSHNPFAEKIKIGNSSKIKSLRSNNASIKTSTKRRRVDSFVDEIKSLPLLTTITSSDTSSSESSDDDESKEGEIISLPEHVLRDVDVTSSVELQFDDCIIEDLETLSLISDNPNIATISRKIAKPRSKKQVTLPDEDSKRPTTEKRDGKSRSVENVEGKEKGDEVLHTTLHPSKKFGTGRSDQKILKKNDVSETPRAGFTGSRAHKYLDMLDNQEFKARHQKIIAKRAREANLSGGISSLLGGFKPTRM